LNQDLLGVVRRRSGCEQVSLDAQHLGHFEGRAIPRHRSRDGVVDRLQRLGQPPDGGESFDRRGCKERVENLVTLGVSASSARSSSSGRRLARGRDAESQADQ
jgi:hypothetical protein